MNSVSIEVVKKRQSGLNKQNLIEYCRMHLLSQKIRLGTIITEFEKPLADHLECLIVGECCDDNYLDLRNEDLKVNWFVYSLNTCSGEDSTLSANDEFVPIYKTWVLPSADFHKTWEYLIYDHEIKENLLNYVYGMLLISEKGADPNIVCSNRVVLLHGPPGTGKTSLCRALAQKLAVRLKDQYTFAQFIEINSHSLFSKWFAESGKLVSKMFSNIYEILEDKKMFVFILIDEVESLTYARANSLSGTDPTDAVRVVNAVLTHLDHIKRYPNVLILTTSNLTKLIDDAFVDRADVKQYIGLPTEQAIYYIYYSCIQELTRVGVIITCDLENIISPTNRINFANSKEENPNTKLLMEISERSVGLSGRTLRKVPLTTLAIFLRNEIVSLNVFLNAMELAVARMKNDITAFD